MKQFILLMICLASLSLFGCSEIDNYSEPDSSIEGKLIDATTGELIPGQAPNGARIQLYEGSSVTATTVWAHTDGTYKSEKVFSGTYRIIPQGPFMVNATDTVKVNIPANGNIDFTVEPYLRISLDDATLSGTTATVKFTINKSALASTTLQRYIVLYSTTENIDVVGYIQRVAAPSASTNFTADAANSMLGVQQTATIENINTNRPVYIRVAAISTGAYYNYSVIKKL